MAAKAKHEAKDKPGKDKPAKGKLAKDKPGKDKPGKGRSEKGKLGKAKPQGAKIKRGQKRLPAMSPVTPAGTEAPDGRVLDALFRTVTARRGGDPAVSHSARLLARGSAKVAQKLGEEAVETVIEAARGNRDAVVTESADLLYHLSVVWVDAGVQPAEVWAELRRREGTSGIAEKAARSRPLAGGSRPRKPW